MMMSFSLYAKQHRFKTAPNIDGRNKFYHADFAGHYYLSEKSGQ
jgi:hypothetical protein